MQTQDAIREQVQRDIRQAVRDASNAARDAQRAAQARVAAPPASRETVDLLRAEIAGVKKEIADLTSQLTADITHAREAAIQTQLEGANNRLLSMESALTAALGGRTTSITRAAMPPDVIPREAVTISAWFLSTMAVTIVSVALIRAVTRRGDRRAQMASSNATDMSPRLERIEQAIEAVAIEVERISEGQRYTNKVMGALPAGNAGWPGIVQREAVPVRSQGEG